MLCFYHARYDQLNRLSHAETLDNSWGYTYTYDGFGNLTGKIVTKGTAITGMTGFTVGYDPATNHGSGYDANGNAPVNGECPSTGCYDVENRLRTPIVAPSWGFYIPGSNNPNNFGNYVYDPWGKRVAWRDEAVSETGLETKCELYIYGISGQRVASYGCGYQAQDGGGSVFQWTLKGYNVYFAGQMIQSNGVTVTTDRLGSVRKNGNSETFKYLPYGEELTSTPDGREKFATYQRDSGWGTDYGLDYADQRYYDRGSGRFLTPDPGGMSAGDPMNPGSWNRYAYALGDPANLEDPEGLASEGPPPSGCFINGLWWPSSFCSSGRSSTALPGRLPLSLDPAPLTAKTAKDLATGFQKRVAASNGTYTDCQALADFTADAAYLSKTSEDFVTLLSKTGIWRVK
jgi:RHS repeat-associated protein